jgi:GNAT superfamily N-acetyltransferase
MNDPICDLGNGLVLRCGRQADANALSDLYGGIFGQEPGESEEIVRAYTCDLVTGEHPTVRASDFTVVEDTGAKEIVSALCLIPQTWTYAGIPFGVGRVEMVATRPEVRRRGLIRAQFEVVHRWSQERGHRMQAITGIPNYYRQFGYEMAMDLEGGRGCYPAHVPRLKEGEEEPYCVRPAVVDDIPFMSQVYGAATQRKLIACPYDERMWRYELEGRREHSDAKFALRVIETPQGEPLGYVAHVPWLHHQAVAATGYELKDGVSWLAVTPSVLRYLDAVGRDLVAKAPQESYQMLQFWFGAEHPLYDVFRRGLPHAYRLYAWYIRIADLADFIRHIAPVLEQRLAASYAVGHSGELKLSFYRDGLRLVFDGGRLTAVQPWDPAGQRASASFPDRTFTKLLVGYQNTDELCASFPDCRINSDEARLLLDTLFPKQSSHIWVLA